MSNEPQYQHLRQNTFLLLLASVTLAFFGLIWDFLLAGFWAVALAIIFNNWLKAFNKRLPTSPNLAALFTLCLILLVVVIPLIFVALALVGQSQEMYREIQAGDYNINQMTDLVLENIPYFESLLTNFNINVNNFRDQISNSAAELLQVIGSQALTYTQNFLNLMVQFFLMLYLLFFFLRDGKTLVQAIGDAFPLGEEVEMTLMNRFASVTRATLKGTLIVAMVQGAIGGVLFWAVGIKGAILWGVLMTLLALLPVGGSAIVWVPAGIILLLEGQTISAIVVFLVGSLIIGLIDNFLRPQLVGRETRMPDYLILLATLGGSAWIGLAGFILGPVLAALFITCWEIMASGGETR